MSLKWFYMVVAWVGMESRIVLSAKTLEKVFFLKSQGGYGEIVSSPGRRLRGIGRPGIIEIIFSGYVGEANQEIDWLPVVPSQFIVFFDIS